MSETCSVPTDPAEYAQVSRYYSDADQMCIATYNDRFLSLPSPSPLFVRSAPENFYDRAMDIDGWWDEEPLPGKIGGLVFVGSARFLGLAALVLIPSDSRIKAPEEYEQEEGVATKKRAELDRAIKKYGQDDSFLEQLRQPIREHFTFLRTVALEKFDRSLNIAPWIKILLAKCPRQDAMLEEWKRVVPAMDTGLGKINSYRFQQGIGAGDPILEGTEFQDTGLKGILDLCWDGKLPSELEGLRMPAEFVPPPEFPTWTKDNKDIEPPSSDDSGKP